MRAFEPIGSATLAERPGQPVDLPCVVTSVARQISRRDNSEWGKITVEDFHGTATVLAFKDTWQAVREQLVEDAVVLVRGKVSGRERDEDDPPIFVDEAVPLEQLPGSGALAVQIELPVGVKLAEDVFAKARSLLAEHPGVAPVELTLGNDNGVPAPRFRSRSLKVDPSSETLTELQEIFGKSRVRLVKVGESDTPLP